MVPVWCVDDVVSRALAEDVGNGDLTTEALVPESAVADATVYSKARGVLAGMSAVERVFHLLEPQLRVERHLNDGSALAPGSLIAVISGPAWAILTGERVALNIMQHLSGVATATRELVDEISGTRAQLVDTRKTTPGMRVLEKYAVRLGGGHNHRFGLDDGILIKDNHIKVAGGVTEALKRARNAAPHTLKVEIEVENLIQLQEALQAGADLVMLDNMSPDLMREAVRINAGQVPLEASGGITRQTIRVVAETGVDLISVGTVTHSAPALDISLDIGTIKKPV
jgi:nicotinate-nucleotide pyrophosphorylase (carboxylating)